MMNKGVLDMKPVLTKNFLKSYLIRLLRNFAIISSIFFSHLSVHAVLFTEQSVASLPICEIPVDDANNKMLIAMFGKLPAVADVFRDELICNRLVKTTPNHLCTSASIFRDTNASMSQIQRFVTEPKFGNQVALKTGFVLMGKYLPLDKKTLIPKMAEKPTMQGTLKFLKLYNQSPFQTGGAGDPPKNIPTGKRYQIDLKKPISVRCENGKPCCMKDADLYAVTRDPNLGKDVFVQRANIQAGGAIIPKKNANHDSCSMVLVSSTLAITAAHCVFKYKSVNNGSLTLGPYTDSLVNDLDWVIWTPKVANPKMASVAEQLNGVCTNATIGVPNDTCDFQVLTGARLLYPSIAEIKPNQIIHDIALIEFDSLIATNPNFSQWSIAKLDQTPDYKPADDTLTTITFGRTDLQNCTVTPCIPLNVPYGPQVGWVPSGPTPDGSIITISKEIASQPNNGVTATTKSMQCLGDSGGGLFSGFHAGISNNQMSLIGIVSTISGKGDACSGAITNWISPHAIRTDICKDLDKKKITEVGLKPFCGDVGKP
jgi:hypothetical protein